MKSPGLLEAFRSAQNFQFDFARSANRLGRLDGLIPYTYRNEAHEGAENDEMEGGIREDIRLRSSTDAAPKSNRTD